MDSDAAHFGAQVRKASEAEGPGLQFQRKAWSQGSCNEYEYFQLELKDFTGTRMTLTLTYLHCCDFELPAVFEHLTRKGFT